jgi:hypothetical protein
VTCEAWKCDLEKDLQKVEVRGPLYKERQNAVPVIRVTITLCEVHRRHMEAGYPILLPFTRA